MTDVIKDQVFRNNKYVKLLFTWQCSGKCFECSLIFNFVNNLKYSWQVIIKAISIINSFQIVKKSISGNLI